MSRVTEILNAAGATPVPASDELLRLLYDELRQLAAQKMRHERPGQTLDATALVHEAYLRLVGSEAPPHWNGRGHFFAAAAEAMRRILVERARRIRRVKHGGGRVRIDLDDQLPAFDAGDVDVLAVNEALDALAAVDPQAAELVKLHFFGGLPIEEAAKLQGIPARTAYRNWSYAKAWLYKHIESDEKSPKS